MIRRERVHVVVDDTTIAADDLSAIIEPVQQLSDIYDGPIAYEHSMQQFSRAQRIVRAVLLYEYEVNNGCHNQFYANSSGIVWKDALAGLEAIGLSIGAKIISISAKRMGGSPALERAERKQQMNAFNPEFDDLDEALYELLERSSLDAQIMTFVHGRPSDFYFSGIIERIIFPGS